MLNSFIKYDSFLFQLTKINLEAQKTERELRDELASECWYFSKLSLSRPRFTRFLCVASDRLRYEMMCIRRGLRHLTEIQILAIQPLTPDDQFLAIVYFLAISHDLSEIFEHVQNVMAAWDSPGFLESWPTQL